jgi:fructokinase
LKRFVVSDVLKYSADRIPSLSSLNAALRPRLEIQTLGGDGLRYALRSDSGSRRTWKRLSAVPVTVFKDAAGAGDWCTAGILDALGRKGRASFTRASESRIIEAIRHGQSMASVNCRYPGARGGMYRLQKDNFQRIAAESLKT